MHFLRICIEIPLSETSGIQVFWSFLEWSSVKELCLWSSCLEIVCFDFDSAEFESIFDWVPRCFDSTCLATLFHKNCPYYLPLTLDRRCHLFSIQFWFLKNHHHPPEHRASFFKSTPWLGDWLKFSIPSSRKSKDGHFNLQHPIWELSFQAIHL